MPLSAAGRPSRSVWATLATIVAHDDAALPAGRVDGQAPDYYEVVKDYIDLSMIQQ